jgi:ribosome maturation factor RimP
LDYKSLDQIPYYSDCAGLVKGLGYELVELRIVPQNRMTKILAVIAAENAAADIGIDDCAKVHRLLLPRLQALLGTDDTYMEVTSPGMERNIKNAAEFALFIGRELRVWDRQKNDWVGGMLVSCDQTSLTLELATGESAAGTEKEQLTVLYTNIAKAKFIHQ